MSSNKPRKDAAEHPIITDIKKAAAEWMQEYTFSPGDLLSLKAVAGIRRDGAHGFPLVFTRYLADDEREKGPLTTTARADCMCVTMDGELGFVSVLLHSRMLRPWSKADQTLLDQWAAQDEQDDGSQRARIARSLN